VRRYVKRPAKIPKVLPRGRLPALAGPALDFSVKRVYRFSTMIVPDYTTPRLPLFSIRVRGAWEKTLIFQVIHGKQVTRKYSAYDGSAKTHLIPYQPKFAAAVLSWQSLGDQQKRWYTSRAAKLGKQLAGYHYYLSLYLRDKL